MDKVSNLRASNSKPKGDKTILTYVAKVEASFFSIAPHVCQSTTQKFILFSLLLSILILTTMCLSRFFCDKRKVDIKTSQVCTARACLFLFYWVIVGFLCVIRRKIKDYCFGKLWINFKGKYSNNYFIGVVRHSVAYQGTSLISSRSSEVSPPLPYLVPLVISFPLLWWFFPLPCAHYDHNRMDVFW